VTLERLAALATILGIGFAVCQYEAAKEDGRVANTLGYVTRFGSSPVSDSFRNIYVVWGKPDGLALLQATDQTNLASKKIQFIVDHRLDWDAVVVGDFYDQLYICLRRNICDLPLAITMLGRDIEISYIYSGRYLASLRARRGGNAGCGLDALFPLAEARLAWERLPPERHRTESAPTPQLGADACLS
jgi:hypothetical protein